MAARVAALEALSPLAILVGDLVSHERFLKGPWCEGHPM